MYPGAGAFRDLGVNLYFSAPLPGPCYLSGSQYLYLWFGPVVGHLSFIVRYLPADLFQAVINTPGSPLISCFMQSFIVGIKLSSLKLLWIHCVDSLAPIENCLP